MGVGGDGAAENFARMHQIPGVLATSGQRYPVKPSMGQAVD
jgi:hypothetical protein